MSVAAPSRPQIQTWRTGHLTESAAYLAITAETWEHAFSTAYNHTLAPGGSPWSGQTAHATIVRAHDDRLKVFAVADTLHETAARARSGAAEIEAAQRRALATIARAEEAGLAVHDDLSVSWESSGNDFGDSIGEAEAKIHAAHIWAEALSLVETDTAVANSLTTTAGLGPLPEPPAVGPLEADAVQLPGPRWGATTELPPAPAGKEWHYYWNWGWTLEAPLKNCSTGEKFWDTALIVTGGLGAIFTGPVGFIAGLAVAGEASHELGQCK
ncbi:hypothetical protein MCHIJ_47750 [Mycolicibacterium chitae]|uniref:Putative conserved membrane protein n=1 Tax=Mycolicibacterium chitae TaxID=1792 RepID=A0A3S4VJD0_MYCCI|nr:hypothetical protein [Mycolicibacterium chitae]MCV7106208.1 hypothetical protein [Mycolicibacterium chitae]BBZ05338.1 hypothetical protein MCHIJ_47750 [Mycolicibacterium chitae]VEG48957.1 putative conserved membrane protein [Mycolicibacterium chitae]